MRADRLVAILLLLQQRTRVTAAEVAAELEISERTARRDLEALGVAGLPVYSVAGRTGGWRLAGGAKTDLSGLTSMEARALFMVAGTTPTATPELKAALRKLVRALPEQWRDQAEATATSVVVDPAGWGQQAGRRSPPALLDAVQDAVVSGRQLQIGYVARDQRTSQRVVDPYGLAAKGASWYLIANTDQGERTFRVDRITSLEPTGVTVVRPAGFDVANAWRAVADRVDELRSPARGRALVNPKVLPMLRYELGPQLRIGPSTDDGRVEVELRGLHHWSIAARIAGFSDDIEVLDPPELRACLRDIGESLVRRYAEAVAPPTVTDADPVRVG